ncbi:MAG TPA: nucleotidyltransferase family protein [Burkholderiaceae bacterium]|nr:nucleotidyltransferase family protein [Burkholderiaceae bacterium]
MAGYAARIVGVLLAAGRGTRFDPRGDRLKLLEPASRGPNRGAPLAVAAARALRPAVDDLVAVVAPVAERGQPALHRLLAAEGCALVVNDRSTDGQGSSIACGIAATAGADGWIVALADMPAVATATAVAVVAALRGGAVTAAPSYHGRRGHPVGFAATLQQELLALAGDVGARAVLARHPPHLIEVDDPGVLFDVDTSEDLR